MDWTQYLALVFMIFAPAYYFYNIYKQDKQFSEWENSQKTSK